jgi:hypothetical protein
VVQHGKGKFTGVPIVFVMCVINRKTAMSKHGKENLPPELFVLSVDKFFQKIINFCA